MCVYENDNAKDISSNDLINIDTILLTVQCRTSINNLACHHFSIA